MNATARHRHHTWIVDQPITTGLTYRTRTGTQAYRVVTILGGDTGYAIATVERLNGIYAGNHDTHAIRYETR